jgi:hypothetical protein
VAGPPEEDMRPGGALSALGPDLRGTPVASTGSSQIPLETATARFPMPVAVALSPRRTPFLRGTAPHFSLDHWWGVLFPKAGRGYGAAPLQLWAAGSAQSQVRSNQFLPPQPEYQAAGVIGLTEYYDPLSLAAPPTKGQPIDLAVQLTDVYCKIKMVIG